MRPTHVALVAGLLVAACPISPAFAHHTYAVFDMNTPRSVEGSVAKLEFRNPHISLWMYVRPEGAKPGQYDLWHFQSDSVNMAQRNGWSKDVVRAGDRATLHFFPLRNGEHGGYLIRLVRPDGTELIGDANAPGVGRELAKTGSLPKRATP